jgi:CRISPR system Cascade subunit CasA
MSESPLDLLTEPLITAVVDESGCQTATLPGVLALLSTRRRVEFTYLQAHQAEVWHAFLVSLAGLALVRGGEIAANEETWRSRLLALTDGEHEPWSLVVEDVRRPAFLQPPFESGSIANLKNVVETPDDLGVLVTSKNHDVKFSRIKRARPEHWIYALVALQTMEGFLGAGNYGISRMNGGFGNRPFVATAQNLRWSERFRRDVQVLLDVRDDLVENHGYADEQGLALVWLRAWDGTTSLTLNELDPFYVEICRRVRLEAPGGRIRARTTGTKTARIDTKAHPGVTGDIWTPVRPEDGTPLTLGADGFTYKRTHELIFQTKYRLGPAGVARRSDSTDLYFSATALVRGQGRTEGFRQRVVPIPAKVTPLLEEEALRDDLARRSTLWIEKVADVQKRVLKPALCALLQGGPDKLDLTDDRVAPWVRKLDERVDEIFFTRLWASVEQTADDAMRDFEDTLIAFAAAIVEEAIASLPVPVARRYRAIARAINLFEGATVKAIGRRIGFPHRHGGNDDHDADDTQ